MFNKTRQIAIKKHLALEQGAAPSGVSLTELEGEASKGSGYKRCVYVRDVSLWSREWLMFGVQRGRQIADMGAGVELKGPKGREW